jgi:GrpB-like predicted nucleotidyltransferase (UPF0157 family)
MLGLDSEKVMLEEYDRNWHSNFQNESKLIMSILGDLVIDIQHFGSTSIEGLKAKPIIDILVGLKSFDQIDQLINEMQEAGYIYAHWAGIPNDYTFRKGENITTHLIHVVEYGKNNWIYNIKFRDALKNNPALIKEYEQLKGDLAQKYPDSREKYTEGKGKFILDVVSKR